MKKKVRIEEVAKAAGVSPTTVSRVINKLPTVKESNRIRVEEAIRNLKFKPDVTAQRLAKGGSDAIGLVIPRYEGIFFSFYAIQIIRGVGMATDSLKLDLLLHLSDGKNPINIGSVGGVLFADIISNREELDNALNNAIHCVVMNYHLDDNPDVSYVAINNKMGATQATDYLISLGHQKIAHITGDLMTQAANERLKGYQAALKNHNIDIKSQYLVEANYSRPSAREAMNKLLKLSNPPTAVFVASDDMAQEAIAVISENKLNVPQDISVVGFDDNPICVFGSVGLTTVRQPLMEMALEATTLLHKMIASKESVSPKRTILPTELVIRDSCRQI